MSHYTVAVLHDRETQDIDDLLAPYSEELEVESYVSRTKTEMIESAKERVKDYNKNPSWYKDDEIRKMFINPYLEARTDEEYYRAERANVEDNWDAKFDDDGNELSTYNPKSKWDWYIIGGRWSGMLTRKGEDADDSMGYDSLPIKDIDFSRDEVLYAKHYDWWVNNIDNEVEEWNDIYTKEYYQETYNDAEDYANQNSQFGTFAILTPDGEWHERGEMGWFGFSSETPDEGRQWCNNYMDIINSVPDNYYMTIVDCHI